MRSPTTARAGCTPAVYIFAGSGVTPDDIDGIAPDPVTTANVKQDTGGVYRYKAAFLEAGDYTLAYTCDAAADDPTIDNTVIFSNTTTTPVTVTTNSTTTYNFP